MTYNVVFFITTITGIPFYGQPKQKQFYECAATNPFAKWAVAIRAGMSNLSDMVGGFHKI